MDGEAPSVFSCEYPTARKEHKCCECGRTIRIGDRYEMFKGIWEGKAGRFKTCKPCADLRGELAKMDYDREAPPFGYLRDAAHDADMEWPPEQDDSP